MVRPSKIGEQQPINDQKAMAIMLEEQQSIQQMQMSSQTPRSNTLNEPENKKESGFLLQEVPAGPAAP